MITMEFCANISLLLICLPCLKLHWFSWLRFLCNNIWNGVQTIQNQTNEKAKQCIPLTPPTTYIIDNKSGKREVAVCLMSSVWVCWGGGMGWRGLTLFVGGQEKCPVMLWDAQVCQSWKRQAFEFVAWGPWYGGEMWPRLEQRRAWL